MGRSAVHELARHKKGVDTSALAEVCFEYLALMVASRRSEVLNRTAYGYEYRDDGRPEYRDDGTNEPYTRTLGEMIERHDSWHLLPQLVAMGLDVHWNPVAARAGRVLLNAVRSLTSAISLLRLHTCHTSNLMRLL